MQLFRIVALIFTAMFVAAAHAQVPVEIGQSDASSTEAKKLTYFLIDISGSMEGRNAEGKVSELLNPILETDPNALVSRTYFRASDRFQCWEPVEIGALVVASESNPQSVQYRNDFTPLGQALRSAILEALGSGSPADIYLISDEEQTSDCGVDVCRVLSSYAELTMNAGINIQSVPVVGTNATDHDRLGCVEGAQGKYLSNEVQASELLQNSKNSPTEQRAIQNEQSQWETMAWDALRSVRHFFEYWAWLIGFALIAYWGTAFGYRHRDKAITLEDQTKEIQLLRDLIRQGDESAGPRFDARIKENRELMETEQRAAAQHSKRRWVARQWSIVLGGALLVALAVLPDEVGIYRAKQYAWNILDSDFATAFAGTWIAILFFAGSQIQRHVEAERNYGNASNDTKQVRDTQASLYRKSVLGEYATAYDGLADIELPPPWTYAGDDGEAAAAFERVKAVAVQLAQGPRLSIADGIEKIESETTRLRALAARPSIWGRLTFARFLERLLSDSKVNFGVADWAGLSDVMKTGISSAQIQKIKELDGELQGQ